MKTRFCAIAALLILVVTTQAQADFFLGETFTASVNASPTNFSSNEDLIPSIGPFTVGAGNTAVGTSLFNPNASFVVNATESMVNSTTSVLTIMISAQDVNGNLVNPIADGSLAQNGNPFSGAWLDIGQFNGGTNGLTVNTTDPNFTVSSQGLILSTSGLTTNGIFTISGTTPVTGTLFAGLPGDASTFTFNDGSEFAGLGVRLTVSAVPEPSSVMLLCVGVAGILLRRRR